MIEKIKNFLHNLFSSKKTRKIDGKTVSFIFDSDCTVDDLPKELRSIIFSHLRDGEVYNCCCSTRFPGYDYCVLLSQYHCISLSYDSDLKRLQVRHEPGRTISTVNGWYYTISIKINKK